MKIKKEITDIDIKIKLSIRFLIGKLFHSTIFGSIGVNSNELSETLKLPLSIDIILSLVT